MNQLSSDRDKLASEVSQATFRYKELNEALEIIEGDLKHAKVVTCLGEGQLRYIAIWTHVLHVLLSI